MKEQVYLFNMFPDYVPPEELAKALSQAAIVAADIDPESRSVSVAVFREEYIPQRLLQQAAKDIAFLYGLKALEITATHPEDQLQKIEPEELMMMFVSRDSMARGSLAGAAYQWEDTHLTVKLRGNGKKQLEEIAPQVQSVLRERFAAPVTISFEAGQSLEGKALFEAMESMRGSLMENLPAAAAKQQKPEAKAAQNGDAFFGKPFKGSTVSMDTLNLDMGTIIVEGRVFNIDHKELKKRNAWVGAAGKTPPCRPDLL